MRLNYIPFLQSVSSLLFGAATGTLANCFSGFAGAIAVLSTGVRIEFEAEDAELIKLLVETPPVVSTAAALSHSSCAERLFRILDQVIFSCGSAYQ